MTYLPNQGGSPDFLGLLDTPGSYAAAAGDVATVNGGETALEFSTPSPGVTDFLALTDTPGSYAGQAGESVRVNPGETGLEYYTPGAGASSFLTLSDTPGSYAGQAGESVRVNPGETALEYYTPGGGGGLNYTTAEQSTGLTWINGKTVFQKTVDFGALPNNTTKNVAHGIVTLDEVIEHHMWSINTSTNVRLSVPFSHTTLLADNVQLTVDNTNVILITGVNLSIFNQSRITLYYTKV